MAVNSEVLQIIVNENLEDELPVEKVAQTTQTKNAPRFIDKQEKSIPSEKKSTAIPNNDNVVKKSKRKPISF